MIISVTLLISCTQANKIVADQKSEEKVANFSDISVTNKPTVIRWATHENYYEPARLNSNLEVWQEIEKKTNIKIMWEVLPFVQYDAAMSVKLASGANLPDMVVVPNYDPTPYGQSGLFIPIEDYIEKYAPNILKIFKSNAEYRDLMTSTDGHIYGLAPIVKGSADTLQPTFAIRKDWLVKLNLMEPTTLNDWVDVLRAFKDSDPNGNGLKDEIPFMSSPYYFSEAFGLQLKSGSDYFVKGKEVKYQWAEQSMLDYLAFVNKLYNEGLLGYNYWNRPVQTLQSYVVSDRVGSFVSYPDWVNSWGKKLNAKTNNKSKYIPILPPMGTNGERSLDTTTAVDKRFSSITSSCKEPVNAVKLLDYLWSEEGVRYLAWGIEGKTYKIENGVPKFTDFVTQNPNGLGMSDALRSVGAWPTIPWIQQREQYEQMLSLFAGFENFSKDIKPILKEPFPMFLAGKEEQTRLMHLENGINNYREEMIDNFIIGKEPLSKFKEYINTLKGMGLDELLKIKQKQYDRYLEQKNLR